MLYKKRNQIARFFNKINQVRRLARASGVGLATTLPL
jgi:transposase